MSSFLRSLRFQCRAQSHLAATSIRGSARLFSEQQPRKEWKRYSSPVFPGLLIFGLGLTAYGLYQRFHDAMTMWPPELRQNLRRGLYAKRKGDLGTAVSHLSRAWETTKAAPLDALGPDPLLKMSGVAITLAGVLEDAGVMERAYYTYEEGLSYMISKAALASESVQNMTVDSVKVRLFTPEDKIRASSIAYKLGELANTLQKPLSEEERWLTLSVDILLSIMPEGAGHHSTEMRKTLEGLDLPSWVMLNDFAAPFEALGSFYARTGMPNYASPLYTQAISFLLSDAGRSPTVEDKCRGAQLMGNLAELSLRSHPSDSVPPEVLASAEARLKEALALTQAARNRSLFSRHDSCEEVYVVLLYNFAMLRQFAGDVDTAREHFRQSLHQAKTINMQEGISNAEAALSELDSSE